MRKNITQTRKDEIDQNFALFHEENPNVYKALVRLARKSKAMGCLRVGIEYIFNIARWELMLETNSDNDVYKLNNNYKSRYSRLIMKNENDLMGFFTTRNANYQPIGD